MKLHNPSPHKFSGAEWQTLGELEVRAGSDAERAIQAWLTETLQPLELHGDLFQRICRSAWEAATRVLQFNGSPMQHRHIHLLAFAPRNYRPKAQTWGFFRLEKLENPVAGQSQSDHSIEFYIYAESKAGSDDDATPKRQLPG